MDFYLKCFNFLVLKKHTEDRDPKIDYEDYHFNNLDDTMPELFVKSITPQGLCDILQQVHNEITYVSIELNQQITGGGPIVDGKRIRTYQTIEYIWKGNGAPIPLENIEKVIKEKSHVMKQITVRCGEIKSIVLTNWDVKIYGYREFPLFIHMIDGTCPKIEFYPL